LTQFLALMMVALSATSPLSPDSPTGAETPSQSGPLMPGLKNAIATPDGAVPLDWSGPAAKQPGADANVEAFDPTASLFGPSTLCVVTPGQPTPSCAATPDQGLKVTSDIFSGDVNPDSTCQTQEDVRIGADGKPQRVFATVCGDEADSWTYRQRAAAASKANPSRSTNRVIGPNDLVPQTTP